VLCGRNIGDGGPSSNFFLASGTKSDPVWTYTNYDKLVNDVPVVLMNAFSENDTSFVDTRLLCVGTNSTTAGSRLRSAGNVLRNLYSEAWWFGVEALMISV
jgi:hypothetical protein